MADETMALFEDAITRWQINLFSNDAENRIGTTEFVLVMFRIADERGFISCHAMDQQTLSFVIGETETRTYTFTPFHGLRVLLAAIAHAFWEQEIAKTGEIGSDNFNAYGDERAITIQIDEHWLRFQVETANTNGKSLSFRIRKL